MLVTPFIMLSVVPAALLPLLGGSWFRFVLAIVLTHVLACSGDLFFAALIAMQVPREARIHNKGWSTHWKVLESDTDLSIHDASRSAPRRTP